MLYESASDAKVKDQARAILDWMTVEAALHYFDGFQAGPDVRGEQGAYRKFAGSVWPYAYLYFTDAEHSAPYSDAEAAARFGVQEAGDEPTCLTVRRGRPSKSHSGSSARRWRYSRPNRITGWTKTTMGTGTESAACAAVSNSKRCTSTAILLWGSVATLRPDGGVKAGGQMPFAEQNLWRLAVRGGQIFGNAGDNDTMAGRCPYEETAQYANVLLRAVKGTDRLWVAVPRAMKVDTDDRAVHVRLGDGLVARLTAKGQRSGPRLPRHEMWSDPDYEQYTWTFGRDEVGALAVRGRARSGGWHVRDGRRRYGAVPLRRQRVEITVCGAGSLHDG